MKNLILGIALVGCVFACKTEKTASVSDTSDATMPAAECCETKAPCSEAQKAECEAKAKDCSKVCPVTGKPQG